MSTPNINQILRKAPRPCKYGAPMGSQSFCDTEARTRIYLQRLAFTDQCYAADGTYWGMPANLWCAFSIYNASAHEGPHIIADTQIFVRASNRKEAVQRACEEFPAIKARILRA